MTPDFFKRTIHTPFKIVQLCYLLALSFVYFNIERLLFYIYNHEFYAHLSTSEVFRAWMGGWKFDISAGAYINLPVVVICIIGLFLSDQVFCSKWMQNIIRWLFFIPNTLAIILNIGDCGYFPFVLKRTTVTVFQEFANDSPISLFLSLAWDYFGLTLLGIILIVLLWWMSGRIQYAPINKSPLTKRIAFGLIETAAVAFLLVGAMRGGWAHSTRPITLSNASLYVKDTKDRDLVLNTPFCMLRTINKKVLEKVHYLPEDEAKKLFSGIYSAQPTGDKDSIFGQYKDFNVMILIVESFAKEHIGGLQQDKFGYTPHIDSLLKSPDVVYFPYAFANGRKSIDAMPSTLTSIPALGINFVTSCYSGVKLKGIPKVLKQNGYNHSIFMHGAPNGSMGFDAFTNQIGYDEYYGYNEFPNAKSQFDGMWGIWDKPFLKQAVKELSERKEPWLGTLFTVTNHTPFKVPEEDEGKYPKGKLEIHQTMGYTDNALNEFFKDASKQPWFKKTIFILIADHASETIRPEYQSLPGRFAIPMIWYIPGKPLSHLIDTNIVTEQADIFPSLLYLLGIKDPIVTSGQNMFDPNSYHYALIYDGDYRMMTGNKIYSMNQEGKVKEETIHTPLLPKLKGNETTTPPKVLPAIIQNFNERLIDDKMVPANDKAKI
ncbi:LTA synthase family protein [Falsiporphyromonas endometrii]|uniref:LTA synthase family protein n=1 Tax=Falsiporphyromonas endometrii TaxID=1387297 RepID=A0ABV9K767_9PORP